MNKRLYYPTYTINPESIYGSGIVKANLKPNVNTTTSVITGSFPNNKKLSPPLYRSGISEEPLKTNGYRILKNPNEKSYKLDDFYYTTQQSNKNIVPIIEPTLKEKLKNKIKNVAKKIINEPIVNKTKQTKQNNNKSKLNNKSNQNINNDLDEQTDELVNYIDDEIKQNVYQNQNLDKYGRNKKMWINDHYLYSLEPRYNSVVNPWRAYTWIYPITPNSDNYYVDNINNTPPDPIIVTKDSTNRTGYQAIYLASNLKEDFNNLNKYNIAEEKYEQNKCFQNYNILYFIIIVLILTIYFYKE
jgi:hypothetical protein